MKTELQLALERAVRWERIARQLHQGAVMLTEILQAVREEPSLVSKIEAVEDVPSLDAWNAAHEAGGTFTAGVDVHVDEGGYEN